MSAVSGSARIEPTECTAGAQRYHKKCVLVIPPSVRNVKSATHVTDVLTREDNRGPLIAGACYMQRAQRARREPDEEGGDDIGLEKEERKNEKEAAWRGVARRHENVDGKTAFDEGERRIRAWFA